MMHRSLNFPTFSRYEGSWNAATTSMHGFGAYTFPDGSVYQGYFSDGRFHGFGTLKMVHPQKCVIKGTFVHGRCIRIDEFYFADGLEFIGKFQKDGTLNAKNWDYCDGIHDRLYFNESRVGLEPPGPNAFLTAQRKARAIPKDTYDTGDGIFNTTTGFILLTENTGEKSNLRFVSCAADREYIENNYRVAKGVDDSSKPIEPSPEVQKEIMSCNLRAMCHRHEAATCMCRNRMERDRYFSNLCPDQVCLKIKQQQKKKKKKKDKKEQQGLEDVEEESEEEEEVEVVEKEAEEKKEEITPRSEILLTASSSSIDSLAERSSDLCKEDVSVPIDKHGDDQSLESEERSHISIYHKKEAMAKITRYSTSIGGSSSRENLTEQELENN